MKCSKCGAECSGNFCSNCGAKLESIEKNKNNNKPEHYVSEFTLNPDAPKKVNNSDKKIIIALFTIGLTVLLIVLGVVYQNNSTNTSKSSYAYDEIEDDDDEDYYSNDYDDYDSEDENNADEEPATEPKITYKNANLKKLINHYSDYGYRHIKTTIKVTKADFYKGEYSYTVYETKKFDKITIKFTNVFPKKKKIVKGGFLTVQGELDYDEDDYDDELTLTIDADKRTKTDKTLFKKLGSEKKPTVYEEGQYRVGTDMKPGDYIAYTFGGGYYCISSDANGDDIVANNNFDNQNYIHVNSGQYLELSDCWIRPVSEKSKVTYYNGYLEDGQYKVGDDIAPGTYKVTATGTGDYDGYFCITSDANGDNIISNDNFGGTRYITISYGQYLELSDCKIKVK